MKPFIMLIIACAAALAMPCTPVNAQEAPLLGIQPRPAFLQQPYFSWFDSTYRQYSADAAATADLRANWGNAAIDVYLGTWCGDSRREVPRLLKALDAAGIPQDAVRLICTKTGNPGHKTSPGREEQGLYVFRVPTFIVWRNGREAGRIVELPAESLEKDLVNILAGKPPVSPYAAGEKLRRYFESTSPDELSSRITTIAAELRPLARSEAEITGFGSVLLSAGDDTRAIIAFRLNTLMFPAYGPGWYWLAEGHRRRHEREKAIAAYRTTLSLLPGETGAQRLLDSLQAL